MKDAAPQQVEVLQHEILKFKTENLELMTEILELKKQNLDIGAVPDYQVHAPPASTIWSTC